MGALRVIGGGLFFPDPDLVGRTSGGSGVAVTEGLGVVLSWRALKFRFFRIGVAMTGETLGGKSRETWG